MSTNTPSPIGKLLRIAIVSLTGLGFVVGWLFGYLTYEIWHANDIRAYYRNQGHLDGIATATQKIREEFGVYQKPDDYQTIYNIKASSVVSIETSGVKTIRVYD